MKSSLVYRGKKFGNTATALKYDVTVSKPSQATGIHVLIAYSAPAAGRGAGDTFGSVTGWDLTIPAWVAKQIALGLLAAAELDAVAPIRFAVDESQSGLARLPAA